MRPSRPPVVSGTKTKSRLRSSRRPLCDISNVDVRFPKSNSNPHFNLGDDDRDHITILDEDGYAPDSVSPQGRSSYPRILTQKYVADSESDSPPLSQSVPLTPLLPKKRLPLSANRNVSFASTCTAEKRKESPGVEILSVKCNAPAGSTAKTPNCNGSPELQFVGQKPLSQNVRDMTKCSDEMYNQKFATYEVSTMTSVQTQGAGMQTSRHANETPAYQQSYKSRDSSSGGKLTHYGPRRNVKPGFLFQGEFEIVKQKIFVSTSQVKNYKAICYLASSQYSNEDAVTIGKVRCTFWSLGESLKPDGFVNSFVVSAFCYSLYIKPNGQPHLSKCHYFFANIGENLLKEPDEVHEDVIARAFIRSTKRRPLNHCNNHWFLFVVDIKDHKFVFLDSLHHENHEYQENVRDKLVPTFQVYWDKYVQIDMNFDEYECLYPDVPQQPLDNTADSGIYTMMFMEHWKSPRTVLRNIFDASDIPSIRIQIANGLLFMLVILATSIVSLNATYKVWREAMNIIRSLLLHNHHRILKYIGYILS